MASDVSSTDAPRTAPDPQPAPEPRTDAAEALPDLVDLGLPAQLVEAVLDLGFVRPTPIQAQAIPALLSGRDLLGVAQTGTGKTAAFGLPLLAAVDLDHRGVQGIVLVPTRELALQVADAITGYAKGGQVGVVAVYGGAPFLPQRRAIADGAQIVVGTPGRVIDHLSRGSLQLGGLRMLVLDEADEMLRMGFAEDVETIMTSTPAGRQVALFSATMPPAIARVAATHLRNPVRIQVSRPASTVAAVTQTYAVVPFRHKVGALARVLATRTPTRRSSSPGRATRPRRSARRSSRGASPRRRSPATWRRRTGSGSSSACARAPSTSWSRPTSPRAAWTSTGSAWSSTSTCRRSRTPTCTASGGPGGPDAAAPP